jgi:teichuronic acid biosynthesis glycosyltransferase TuaG
MLNEHTEHEAELYTPSSKYDCLIFTKTCRPEDLKLLKSFKGLTVLDLCDNILEPSKYVSQQEVEISREMAKTVTAISVCSEYLGEKARKYNKNIFYIPDMIDQTTRKYKILWFGLASNYRTLKQHLNIFGWLSKNHDFEIHAVADWSNSKEVVPSFVKKIEWEQGFDLSKYDLFFGPKMNVDLEWEYCKSDNKLLYALKSGLDCIVSPIPEYKKAVDLFSNKVSCFNDLFELEELLKEKFEDFYSIQNYHSREFVLNELCDLFDLHGIQIPLVSVITPAFNCEKIIGDTIESVLAQSYKKFEYIIVNDCSTDNTLDVIKEYATIDSRIKIINNKKNLGQEKSKNKALKFSSGDIIVPIDNDDLMLSNRIELSVKALKDYDIVYGDYFVFGDTKERLCKAEEFDSKRMLTEKNLINANTVAFKRGLFYGSSCKFAGDYECWLRAVVTGKKFGVIHKPLTKYRVKNNSLWHNNLGECEKEKEKLQVFYSNVDLSKPKVSIIMPTFNRKLIIPKSIESVLSQTFQEWELIIVNDGGEDISSVIDFYNDKRIKYVQKENGGLSSTLNYGIRLARANLVSLLDDDDLWKENHLEILFDNINYYDIVFSNCKRIKPNGSLLSLYNLKFNKKEIMEERNLITTCSVLFKKKVWTSVKGFDESLISHMDWDFWKKAVKQGFSFKRINKFTCFYITHGGNMLLSRNPIHEKDRIMVKERYL